MKRILICLVALFLVVGGAQAAEINTTAGTKALLFQFSGLSNLGLSGYAGGIGARWYMSDGMALRPGVNVDVASNKVKGLSGFSDAKDSRLDLGLTLAVEQHLQGPKSVSPYIGAGVGFDVARHTTEPSVPDSPPSGTLIKTKLSATSFGLFALGGFEWGFAESLTLGGEYRVGLSLGSGSTESERQELPTVKSNEVSSLNLGVSTASVFLSVTL